MIRKFLIAVLTLGAEAPSIVYESLIDVVVLAVMGIMACLGWLVRQRIRRRLRRQLMQNGQPVCLKCGHSLIGNSSGMCPECGTERQ